MHPGDYVGTQFGASAGGGAHWRWDERLGARMRERGLAETVLELSGESLGFVLRGAGGGGGAAVAGGLTVLQLLEDPAVRDQPWVRLVLPDSVTGSASNALWKASGLAGGWWDGLISGRRLSADVEARLENRFPDCPRGLPRACLEATFLAPVPAFQRTLLPYVSRADAARAGGGVVVGLHLRSGYADHAASGPDTTGDPPATAAPKAEEQLREAHAAHWLRLNAAYAQCGAAPPPPPNVCLHWSEQALSAMRTGGASCARAGSGAVLAQSFVLETGASGDGALGSLLACAAHSAASRSVGGGAAPWLLFVAGDLPPFFLLANRSAALAGHVATAEGLLGHVSFNRVCSVRPGSPGGGKTCRATGADPGGAWTRTMVDWFVLGGAEALLRVGTSSFPGAVRMRGGGGGDASRLWPQDDAVWAYEVVPHTEGRAFAAGLHAIADEILHALEAEDRPS